MNSTPLLSAFAALALTSMVGEVSSARAQQASSATEGICVLTPTEGHKVTGTISLLEEGDNLHIAGEVRHLVPGLHGFHIHQFGDLREPDASTCGGPYNPTHGQNASSESGRHFVGDLGNIEANAQGIALVDIKVPHLKIHAVLGRSLVVHGSKDELRAGPSGDSGPRVAAGVIGYRRMP